MDIDIHYFNEKKEKARQIFSIQKSIRNPYFQREIILNSDGFHHLQFSNRMERDRHEQLLKFRLLPLGLEIIKKSGTIQEYRKLLTPIGKPLASGAISMKEVQYWGMAAIVGQNQIEAFY